MGINVSTKMEFTNREFLKKPAKKFAGKENDESGKKQNNRQEIINDNSIYLSAAEVTILKNNSQVSINNNLKETLKYLQMHAQDKRKQHILGELWGKMSDSLKDTKDDINVLADFEVNFEGNNIFAA